MRIALVSSAGGHLTQLLDLAPVLRRHDCFLVVNDQKDVDNDLTRRVYVVAKSQRDLLTLWNFVQFWRLFRRERPEVVVSTGAGLAVPAFLVARLLRIRTVFIEIYNRVQPSLTARLVYPMSDLFVVAWPQLLRRFPRASYGGPIFDVRDRGTS